MSQTIHFQRPDGESAPGYLAEPAGGPAAPGVVVLQEWWGVNEQIQKTADRLAAAGFRALVPDLYRGRRATTADEATHMMNGLDWADAVHQDLRGATAHLKSGGGKAAVLGFCMGGALALAAGVHVPEADAGVCFYGIPPVELADAKDIRIPLLCHFATQDEWCSPQRVEDLEKTLQAAGVEYELHRYEAQHAFFNEARPEVYAPQKAQLAWERSLVFLEKKIGS